MCPPHPTGRQRSQRARSYFPDPPMDTRETQEPRFSQATYLGLRLPNGMTVIPTADLVVEYRPDGRVLWAELYVDDQLAGLSPVEDDA